ncbi:Serine-threonine protein kinase 19 [Forsythia ovata]|uniref:Serine-threonine protein kinase 19 n=1 Tax=Forsythia ovata TaxID=205694 RepID=A0ABD1RKM2_9LAMI
MVALQIMRAQFPHIEKVSFQPFVLQSQLYSNIKDMTQVDRELESLRRDRVLRIFKLNTGQDDHAVMFMDDYLNQIEHVVKRMEVKTQDDLMVFEWFKTHVIHSKHQHWSSRTLFTSVPGGKVLKGLSQGRNEVLSFLNRRKYKEMMLAPLEKKCLRFSPLDMRFHLRGLIDSGRLSRDIGIS